MILPHRANPRGCYFRERQAGNLSAGSAEKETSRAVPRFFGITQRVPIVVGPTGEYFGLVMLDFSSVRFCSGNYWRNILCWCFFFRDL